MLRLAFQRHHFIAKNIATKQPRTVSLKFKLFTGIDNVAIARQRQCHVLNRTKKFHTSLQMNAKKQISSIIIRNKNNSNIVKQQKKTFFGHQVFMCVVC